MANIDMFAIAVKIFGPVVSGILSFIGFLFGQAVLGVILFFVVFFVKYRVYGEYLDADRLESLEIRFRPYDFLRWKVWDFLTRQARTDVFDYFGFTIFVGRQGSGKTISMVHYLDMVHQRFPDALIVTNFAYANATHVMSSWKDFFEIRNEERGVVFAIDEIHGEYSAKEWKDFPEALLSQISQQCKQRVKIIASAQVYNRVVKQIREQAFSVMVCKTFCGRLTWYREYDAAEYDTSGDSAYSVKKRCKPLRTYYFVQSNRLRSSYDTFEVIERLKGREFIPRDQRGM